MTAGILRALAPPEEPAMRRVVARRFPRAARHYRPHQTAICEVARMLTDRLGLPASIHSLFAYLAERWDGSGNGHVKGDEIPLAVRIAHVGTLRFTANGAGWKTPQRWSEREPAGHSIRPSPPW
jgi:hypothetical protein